MRKEVQDCKLTLKFVVRKELDQNRYRCQMSHPALREEKFRETEKVLRVHYPPHSLQISGNRTSRMITCNAIANPPPEYFYKIGKSGTLVKIADPKGRQYINELEKLPPNDVISCVADNKVAPKQTVQRLLIAKMLHRNVANQISFVTGRRPRGRTLTVSANNAVYFLCFILSNLFCFLNLRLIADFRYFPTNSGQIFDHLLAVAPYLHKGSLMYQGC